MLEQGAYPYDLKGALQHEDTTLVGKAIAIRDETWAYIYRLYEPAELYHRVDDPYEMHNLAADPSKKSIVDRLEKVILKWLVEGSDFMPWDSDARFPQVTLPSPKEQMFRRWNKRCAIRPFLPPPRHVSKVPQRRRPKNVDMVNTRPLLLPQLGARYATRVLSSSHWTTQVFLVDDIRRLSPALCGNK